MEFEDLKKAYDKCVEDLKEAKSISSIQKDYIQNADEKIKNYKIQIDACELRYAHLREVYEKHTKEKEKLIECLEKMQEEAQILYDNSINKQTCEYVEKN